MYCYDCLYIGFLFYVFSPNFYLFSNILTNNSKYKKLLKIHSSLIVGIFLTKYVLHFYMEKSKFIT